jgi:hypothetical protein
MCCRLPRPRARPCSSGGCASPRRALASEVRQGTSSLLTQFSSSNLARRAPLCRDYTPAGSLWRPGDLAAPDPASLHGGCPVLAGTKVIATRWIRAAEFH